METTIINPWKWQDNFGYSQAMEVKNNHGTLYCSGQAAMGVNGEPIDGTMQQQIEHSLSNLEAVINQAGYSAAKLVRLNIYTTDIPTFFEAYGTLAGWLTLHGIQPASTLVEVKALAFPVLKVEIEAIVVS